MFKVNNKVTRVTSVASLCLYCQLWIYFRPCHHDSIVNFELVNAGWEGTGVFFFFDIQFIKDRRAFSENKRKVCFEISLNYELQKKHTIHFSHPSNIFNLQLFSLVNIFLIFLLKYFPLFLTLVISQIQDFNINQSDLLEL